MICTFHFAVVVQSYGGVQRLRTVITRWATQPPVQQRHVFSNGRHVSAHVSCFLSHVPMWRLSTNQPLSLCVSLFCASHERGNFPFHRYISYHTHQLPSCSTSKHQPTPMLQSNKEACGAWPERVAKNLFSLGRAHAN